MTYMKEQSKIIRIPGIRQCSGGSSEGDLLRSSTKRSQESRMRADLSDLEVDEFISELDIPELLALIRKLADEVELRIMERQE